MIVTHKVLVSNSLSTHFTEIVRKIERKMKMAKQEAKIQLKPLGNRVLVRRMEAQETKGGIILPDTAKKKQEMAECPVFFFFLSAINSSSKKRKRKLMPCQTQCQMNFTV